MLCVVSGHVMILKKKKKKKKNDREWTVNIIL